MTMEQDVTMDHGNDEHLQTQSNYQDNEQVISEKQQKLNAVKLDQRWNASFNNTNETF